MKFARRVLSKVLEDRLLALLLIVWPLMVLFTEPSWLSAWQSLNWIHWPTMLALTGLMVLSRGIEESGYLNSIAKRLLYEGQTQWRLAVMLIIFAALLAAVITNDVALFILVPLLISLARLVQLPIVKLVIFLAFAVNAGSALTPIGNPQNLLLWQASGYSFIEFIWIMSPLVLGMMLLMIGCARLAFTNQTIAPVAATTATTLQKPKSRRLMICSMLGYPLFIIGLELGLSFVACALLVLCYALFARQVLKGVDWFLLLIFALMFINLGMISEFAWIERLIEWGHNGMQGEYVTAALLSQVISNVPAAILLQHYTTNWHLLMWGVSVGGFGLAIGSLANLIAIRLIKKAYPGIHIWRQFHAWSVPLFAGALTIGVILSAWLH
ncbi:MAG: DUF1646 family protein [Idiomarina sp.]|nr:DUF1646 family protein [Idiomarina sp.]